MKRIFKSKYNVLRRYSSLLNRRHHKNKGGESMQHFVIPDKMKPSYQEILDILDKNLSEVLAERGDAKTVKNIKRNNIISYQRILDVFDKNIQMARTESK